MKPISSPATGVMANSPPPTVSDHALRADRIYLATGQLLPFLERGRAVRR